jgi:hypothetical protein
MDATNPILGNIFLLLAILLFLAILPRALRILAQKEKTALDRAVERFEKEELLKAAVGELNENNAELEKADSPKDGSLAYSMEDLPSSGETQTEGGIPPFPTQEEEKEKPVKIIKEGVPISHNELEEDLPSNKKKVKLVKQEISIAPDKSSEKSLSEPLKSEGSDDNWIEAEIPGLIMDLPPAAAEKTKKIPTFKASPKATNPPEAEKPQKPLKKEKQSLKVKNMASKSEKIKDSKPQKQVEAKTDSPELKMEISEAEPKIVEIKAPIASHKNIAKKSPEQKKAKTPSVKAVKIQKTEPEVAAAPPQREKRKSSPEKAKPKPFLLELKYLDQEELKSADQASQEELPADMMDVVIARLHALQTNLENQLVSTPGELTQNENPINGGMRKDRDQGSITDNEPSDKREVSLEELDSFLFTATQRKK